MTITIIVTEVSKACPPTNTTALPAGKPGKRDFDGFYFYNPFAKNAYPDLDCFDSSVSLTNSRAIEDIKAVEAALDEARIGITVVTYHGFGGRMPKGYSVISQAGTLENALIVWRKTSKGV